MTNPLVFTTGSKASFRFELPFDACYRIVRYLIWKQNYKGWFITKAVVKTEDLKCILFVEAVKIKPLKS